ncbi:MAG: penicillin-binding protein 1A [Alphaproteobacteria bacterium]|nr:penicillin-binding protein 1A [Alphaproteobacteria bacterium]
MLRVLGYLTGCFLLCGLIAVGGVIWVFWTYGQGLPDYTQLEDYAPPITTRVHAGDGSLLAEYAVQRRVFVPISAIPKMVRNAFLAAEDQNFYSHPGVDPMGVARAIVTNIRNLGKGRRPEGASTITQQVAQNFLLTKDVSIKRKIREAIISFRIERAFTKDQILELYLNEIYLGFGAYGVASASLNYFNKPLSELAPDEAAFLAALPKGPNNYNPITKQAAAVARRNYVLGRMAEDGVISVEYAGSLSERPIRVSREISTAITEAPYFAEEVRRELVGHVGEDGLYKNGLSVRTTLDPRLQVIARASLRAGLVAYDRRHGWRGPLTRLDAGTPWQESLAKIAVPPGGGDWSLATVIAVTPEQAEIGFVDASTGVISLAQLKWARKWLKGGNRGPQIKSAGQVLEIGHVVFVSRKTEDLGSKPYPGATHRLEQVPAINGAIIAIDPHTGRVLAMTGGLDFALSEFNRATQASRQPGSAFKPIVYLAGLDNGFTPSTRILDAPFVIDQGAGQGKWKPANYTKKFYGPSPMRLGIEKSRNLMTVRLAQTIGMESVAVQAERLGVVDNLPRHLSMSLGAGETTLMRLTAAYAMIVNGGKKITPTLIDRIQDRTGATVFRHDMRECLDCQQGGWFGQDPPQLPDIREKVIEPGTAYQMVSMLQGVIQRGTGRRIAELKLPLGGKTGTTNKSIDTWFVGFSPDLAVGVFVGFDEPRSLGKRETGSSVPAPIFKEFMRHALDGQSVVPFRVPSEIALMRVNPATGFAALPGERASILEAFKPGTAPPTAEVGRRLPTIGGNVPLDAENSVRRPRRGIY